MKGQPAGRQNPNPNGNYEAISPDYFRTMEIKLVIGDGMRPLLMGLIAGLAAAAFGRILLATLLFGAGEFDPTAYAFAALTLLIVALAACLGPALRAVSIDPWRALRSD